MADIPDEIVLKRDRDLEGREKDIWIRRGLLGLVATLIVLALVNVFGQKPGTATANASAATLTLSAPTHLRGGLLWTAHVHIAAHHSIGKAVLVLNQAWADGAQINTIEPSPVSETSRNGNLAFTLGPIKAGDHYDLYMGFQTNPTNVNRRTRTVSLYDGDQPHLHHQPDGDDLPVAHGHRTPWNRPLRVRVLHHPHRRTP
jgi:hypothetical protein